MNEPRERIKQAVAWLLLPVLLVFYVQWQAAPLKFASCNDYKHIYLGSQLLFEGLSPYDRETMQTMRDNEFASTGDERFRSILPYVYLPFTGFVMRPLSLLPFQQSATAFQMLNHALLLAALIITCFAARGIRSFAGMLTDCHFRSLLMIMTASAAFSVCLYRQNTAGQLNVVLLFGYALLALGIMRGWRAPVIGFIAAFLMLFKLSPGILLLWFLFRKEWKHAAWMAAWAAALTLLTVAIFGFKVHADFLPVLSQMGYGKSTWPEDHFTFWRDPYNQSVNAFFHRLFVKFPESGIIPIADFSPAAANAMTWCVSLIILAAFAWSATHSISSKRNTLRSFAAAVLASLLLPSIMWDHYLVQALLPAGILLATEPATTRGHIRKALVILCLIAMAWWVRLDQESFRAFPGLLLMSLELWPVLVLFALSWYPKPDITLPA
ncbi:hypothetical protein BH09SUM1_BH09SUM1_14660 [soil metagenome]